MTSFGSSHRGSAETNLTSVHEDVGSNPGLTLSVKDPVWLWCRPVATALIQPLAWELPYAVGAALKKLKIIKKPGKSKRLRKGGFSRAEAGKGHTVGAGAGAG